MADFPLIAESLESVLALFSGIVESLSGSE